MVHTPRDWTWNTNLHIGDVRLSAVGCPAGQTCLLQEIREEVARLGTIPI